MVTPVTTRLWTEQGLSIRVKGPGFRRRGRRFNVPFPFARIGRFPSLDITIDDPQVSRWHVYLQRMPEGVFFVDLGSRAGLRYKQVLCHRGWLEPDEPLWIGDYSLLVDVKGPPPRFNPLSRVKPGEEPLQPVALTFVMSHGRSEAHPLKRRLTLVGRSAPSNLRLSDPTIARAHLAIYRTPTHAWLVNLAGASAFQGEQPLVATQMVDGADYEIGQFNMRADLGRRVSIHSSEPNADQSSFGQEDLFSHEVDFDELDAKVEDSASVHLDLDFDPVNAGDSSPSAIDTLELEGLNRELNASRAESEHLAALLGELDPAVSWNGRVSHFPLRTEPKNPVIQEAGSLDSPPHPSVAESVTSGTTTDDLSPTSPDMSPLTASSAEPLAISIEPPRADFAESDSHSEVVSPVFAEPTCVLTTCEDLSGRQESSAMANVSLPMTTEELALPQRDEKSTSEIGANPQSSLDNERKSAELAARIEELESSLLRLESRCRDAECQRDEHAAKVAELAAAWSGSQAEGREAKSLILQLQQSVETLTQEVAAERDNVREKDHKLAQQEQSIARMRQNQVKAAEVILERNRALETLNAKLSDRDDAQKELEQKLALVEAKLQQRELSETDLSRKLQEMESLIAAKVSEIDRLEEMNLTAEELREMQQANIAELQRLLAKSQENESRSKAELSELETLVQEKSRRSELEHRRLVDELSAATKDLAQVREQWTSLSALANAEIRESVPTKDKEWIHEIPSAPEDVPSISKRLSSQSAGSSQGFNQPGPTDSSWPSEEEILQAIKQETVVKPDSARRPDLQVAKTLLDRAKHVDPRHEQLRLATWIAAGAVAVLALFGLLLYLN
ncbi:MAG: FHA domain-containing protein [Planctomycetota bacterium]